MICSGSMALKQLLTLDSSTLTWQCWLKDGSMVQASGRRVWEEQAAGTYSKIWWFWKFSSGMLTFFNFCDGMPSRLTLILPFFIFKSDSINVRIVRGVFLRLKGSTHIAGRSMEFSALSTICSTQQHALLALPSYGTPNGSNNTSHICHATACPIRVLRICSRLAMRSPIRLSTFLEPCTDNHGWMLCLPLDHLDAAHRRLNVVSQPCSQLECNWLLKSTHMCSQKILLALGSVWATSWLRPPIDGFLTSAVLTTDSRR